MPKKQFDHRVSIEQLEARRLFSGSGAVTLLQDSFNGAKLNAAIWRQPSYNPDGSTFVGRTQFQVVGHSPAPKVGGGNLRPNLQSYNPTQLRNLPSFWGSEILSNQTFIAVPGKTLDIRLRAKLNAMPGGGVLGLFVYGVNPDGNHDEIDTELESNQSVTGTNQVETNVYADQPLGAGSPASFALPSGGTLTGWHTYEMKLDGGVSIDGTTVTAPSVSWYVDGKFIRTEDTTIPTHRMSVYINFWAPDQGWQQAYNAGIQPTTNPKQNQIWTASVDGVTVRSIADPAPLTVSSASVKIGKPQVAEGHPDSATGTVLGTGNGTIEYYWLAQDPNGNVIQASGTLAATMTHGVAAIRKFSGLSSSYAGVYSSWIHIVSPGTGLDSSPAAYTVIGSSPAIEITSVPSLGSSGNAWGIVLGVNPADYQGVAVFIEVAGTWWTKPYFDAPITTIATDGAWQANIVTGGDDQDATEVAAFLVPLGFNVPLVGGDSSLPSELFTLLNAEVARN